MRRLALALFALLLAALRATPSYFWTHGSQSASLPIVTSITLSTSVFDTTINCPSGTPTTIATVTVNASGGTYSGGSPPLTGTNAGLFQIANWSGNSGNLQCNGTGNPSNIGLIKYSFNIVPLGTCSPNCAYAQTISLVETPGPSAALYNNPYYTCSRNYYVSTSGNDSNAGTSGSPWLTIQHADTGAGGRIAGDCVNVEPGTYSAFVAPTNGGNLASSTGYVVYRCATLDGCTITASNNTFLDTTTTNGPFYFWIDGFNFVASASVTYGVGIAVESSTEGEAPYNPSSHHIWLTNNIMNGFWQSGIGLNDGEYFFSVHNTTVNNSANSSGCFVFGSGIAYNSLKVFSGYSRTADDSNNSVVGDIGTRFHGGAIEWNISYNNATSRCPSGATDGNGITADSLQGNGSSGVDYTAGLLIAFNVLYNNGGAGLQNTASNNITFANNTVYNNNLYTGIDGSARGGINSGSGDGADPYGGVYINNIVIGIPTVGYPTCNYMSPWTHWNGAFNMSLGSGTADVFTTNITQIQGSYTSCSGENAMFGGDSYSCSSNECATNPLFVNAGDTSTSSYNSPPNGANFAIQSESPAIGYGTTETWLSAQAVDAGACYHTLSVCPNPSASPQ